MLQTSRASKLGRFLEIFNSSNGELNSEQQKTLLDFLHYLIQEGLCDTVVLTPNAGKPLAVARDPQFNTVAFEASCSNSIKKAFQNQSAVETVQNNDLLFDVVTIPISVEDTNSIVGTITFGVENSMAQEFLNLTHSELVLLSDSRVVASTLRNASLANSLPGQFAQMTARAKNENDPEQVVLGDEHFLCLAGWLDTPDEPHRIGYLILSSYEKPLQALQSVGQMILLVSSLSILFGAAVIWFLVNTSRELPLRELRDNAEAVGRGDFFEAFVTTVRLLEETKMRRTGSSRSITRRKTSESRVARRNWKKPLKRSKAPRSS